MGPGVLCPVCDNAFFPSHVAKCELLDTAFASWVEMAEEMRMSFERGGLAKGVVEGVGVLETALEKRRWSVAKEMFQELARILGDKVDWMGATDGFVEGGINEDVQRNELGNSNDTDADTDTEDCSESVGVG